MGFKDTIDEIRKEWLKTTESFSNRYKETVESELKRLGVYGVDVYKKRNKKRGILRLTKEYASDISWEIRFIPYKKDGSLSSNSESLYIFNFLEFEDALMDEISLEVPDGNS